MRQFVLFVLLLGVIKHSRCRPTEACEATADDYIDCNTSCQNGCEALFVITPITPVPMPACDFELPKKFDYQKSLYIPEVNDGYSKIYQCDFVPPVSKACSLVTTYPCDYDWPEKCQPTFQGTFEDTWSYQESCQYKCPSLCTPTCPDDCNKELIIVFEGCCDDIKGEVKDCSVSGKSKDCV